MNRELLIAPNTLRAVSYAAAAGQLAALVIPVLCLAEPAVWFAGFPGASIIIGCVSDTLCLALLGLICMLSPWCHEVLVADRGSAFTRLLSWVMAVFGAFLLADSTYGALVQTRLLTDPDIVMLGLSLGLLFTVVINITNIAAAPLWLRICLPAACLCYLGCTLTFGVIELLLPFTLLKFAAAMLLAKPLSILRRNAPRIASLP